MKEAPVPTEIKLHQRTRLLEIDFGDGCHFELPAEYLRAFSPAAMMSGELVKGKESVNITRILPEGNRGIRPHFSDGHDQAVYSWETLYELGVNHAEKWGLYLQRLRDSGYTRTTDSGISIKILYFAKLVERLGRGSEELRLPEAIQNVAGVLAWLRSRGGNWEQHLKDELVQVTVNREFAALDDPLEEGDELGIVPSHPR
ncbi:MAG: DUF971 domain-containing protein [Gammaproteobacteria bacterium]|nr:DUF971 domain-containing protein [Gammaproteobacteria bacterium]